MTNKAKQPREFWICKKDPWGMTRVEEYDVGGTYMIHVREVMPDENIRSAKIRNQIIKDLEKQLDRTQKALEKAKEILNQRKHKRSSDPHRQECAQTCYACFIDEHYPEIEAIESGEGER